jgi:hypothetical protein
LDFTLREERWGTWKLTDVEPAHIRSLFRTVRKRDVSTPEIREVRSAFSAMSRTAVEHGMLGSNTARDERIPAAHYDEGASKG